ncbi:MAG: phenylalanine--tRNA ligase subunit beta, partial [Chloroflexi bacterium]
MRVPLAWLRDYVDVELSPAELREELTVRGMEVTAVEVSGAEWSDVVVGRLLEVRRHPDADTLWVTKVLTEEGGEPFEIVCGAQNIAPGQLVPVALPGATLPGDRQITRTKIRGVVSNGMLCSPRELDLGGDANGIQILGTGREYPLGTDLRTIYGDVVLDVDVKPNRGDALSMVGLAREVAAFTGAVLRKPSVSLTETDEKTSAHVSVTIEDQQLCPRFTARWFSNVSNGPSPDWMQRRLVAAGMRQVTAVEVSGAEWSDVVVGRLLEVRRHPDADTLWVTKVLTEEGGEPFEIVCGAQNIAPGQLVPVALPGATLPGDRQITRTKIRGVVSNGMLCSPRELDLGGDANGIQILGTGREYPLGTDLRTIYGDVVLDVDVKPNRGDALSMVGLAREVAAFTGAVLRKPSVSLTETDEKTNAHVSVTIEDQQLCPRFTARWFSNVSKRRLVAAGMRPVSAVVDVTNYVMHELGQPMHAYDADTVPDGRIVVRRARSAEALETIDHERRTLDEGMLVIADETRAIGLAGIMGGAETEVTANTTRVILESAVFHGPTIRNAARKLGLRSEASMRHEKGISWDVPRYAADRAAQLIAEISGAWVARGIVDNDPEPKARRVVRGDVARTERLLGIPLDVGRIGELLRPLEFEVAEADESGTWEVAVPPHRLDVVEAVDVAEEIARAHGYALIPGRLPRAALPPYRADPSELRHRVRRIMAGLGLSEVVTHALIAPEDLSRTGYDPEDPGIVRVANPLSEAHV